MLTTFKPRLRRSDVVLYSFSSCVSNTPKEFSRTPEMSFSKMLSQPRMLVHKLKGTIAFKQLKSLANTNCSGKLNKDMHMVNSNMQLVDFTPMLDSNLCDESLDINSNSIKFKWVPSILGFPHKVEGILPEGMAKGFQFHFLTPQTFIRNKVLTMFVNLDSRGLASSPIFIKDSQKLNLMKVGSPPMLESKGIRALTM